MVSLLLAVILGSVTSESVPHKDYAGRVQRIGRGREAVDGGRRSTLVPSL